MSSNKLDTWLIVKTVAIWMAIIYAICATAFLLVPTSTLDWLWKPMFHNLSPRTGTYIVLGFLESVTYTAAAVWILVTVYNQLAKKR